jgi:fermentation-respiration switch protein FrsA (DUF1100 family)
MITALWLVALLMGVLWLGQRWLIYHPDEFVPAPHLLDLPGAERVDFMTEDGLRLEGWFVSPTATPTGQTVIVFNGNAGHRGHRAPLAAALAHLGHAVLLFDYRGYGGNPGLPSERGLLRDARAALAATVSRDDVDPARLVYFGESIGSAVAVALAEQHPPHALVLRSPFPSLVEVGLLHYPILPVRWLLRDRFETLARIGALGVPLLVVAGTDDAIIPLAMSEEVYEAASEPKWMVTVEGADHNDQELLSGQAVVAAVGTFLTGIRQ